MYTAAFPVEGQNKGEGGVLSDGLSPPLSVEGKGECPLEILWKFQ